MWQYVSAQDDLERSDQTVEMCECYRCENCDGKRGERLHGMILRQTPERGRALVNDDLAPHPERSVKRVGAAEAVGAVRGSEAHIHRLMARNLHGPVPDRARYASRGREELRSREVVAAFSGVDEVKHDRLASTQADGLGAEVKARQPNLDGPGTSPFLGGGSSRARGEQKHGYE